MNFKKHTISLSSSFLPHHHIQQRGETHGRWLTFSALELVIPLVILPLPLLLPPPLLELTPLPFPPPPLPPETPNPLLEPPLLILLLTPLPLEEPPLLILLLLVDPLPLDPLPLEILEEVEEGELPLETTVTMMAEPLETVVVVLEELLPLDTPPELLPLLLGDGTSPTIGASSTGGCWAVMPAVSSLGRSPPPPQEAAMSSALISAVVPSLRRLPLWLLLEPPPLIFKPRRPLVVGADQPASSSG